TRERWQSVSSALRRTSSPPDTPPAGRARRRSPPHPAEAVGQRLAVLGGRGAPRVGAVLLTHGLGPGGGVTIPLGQARVLEHALEDATHVLVGAAEGWEVRHAETQDGSHGFLLRGSLAIDTMGGLERAPKPPT